MKPNTDYEALDQSRDVITLQAGLAGGQRQIDDRERDILRCLANQLVELAARPIEDCKRNLWMRHNALEKTRPLVFCDPENGWKEIIPPDRLECESALARQWEMHLRKTVLWGPLGGRTSEPIYLHIQRHD